MLKITTADELKAFRDDVNSGNTYEDWYVYLANNITLDINEEWKPIGLYPMENTSPADESNKPFKGIFDGCGYEINGIYINTTDKVKGLFGLVLGGKISNLGIGENCNITGNLSVGAMAGYLYKGTIAINCYNKSNLTGGIYSGALFGQAYDNCNIENCYNIGNIVGTTKVGGIVGELGVSSTYNTIGIMKNSYSLKNSCEDICGYVVEGVTIEKSSIQTEAEMKLLVPALGAAFKKDTNNINQGYPILSWQ